MPWVPASGGHAPARRGTRPGRRTRGRAPTWFAIAALCGPLPAAAQVVFDGSTGPAGAVGSGNVPGFGPTDHLISGDLGQRGGDTLLHGFSRFSIESGRSATFTPGAHAGLARVIARVSGGEASQISGLLRSTIPGADVFLLNPSGVVFSPGAQIDVPAALHVSSGAVLRFADGTTLDATSNAPAVLSSAPPEAFGFLRPAPAPIEVASGTFLNGTPARLSLVGADVRVGTGAGVFATGARVDLVAAGGSAQIPIDDPTRAASQATGRITFDGGNLVGFGFGPILFRLVAGEVVLDHGAHVGTIGVLQAPDIDVFTRDLSIAGGALIDVSSYDASPGGTLRVRASGTVDLSGDPATRTRGGLFAESETPSLARGGIIDLAAERLDVHDSGLVAASVQGVAGSAGEIRLDVGTLVTRDGGSIDVSDRNGAAAHAPGSIDVVARERVSIEPGFWTGADGNPLDTGLVAGGDLAGGHIRVSAPEIHLSGGVVGSDADGQRLATGAPVTLRADRVLLTGEGRVRTTSWTAAPAGDVTVEARESLRFVATQAITTGSRIEAEGFGAGAAGTVHVLGGRVSFESGGRIGTRSGKARLDVEGGAAAGSVVLDVASLEMQGGDIRAESGGTGGVAGGGRAGSIVVRASDHVMLGGNPRDPGNFNASAAITSRANGDSDGGSVTIETPRLELRGGARIDAVTTGTALAGATDDRRAGRAGSVTVRAAGVWLDTAAQISTATEGGAAVGGRAGNVELDAGSLVLDGTASIESSSRSAGDAGEVSIRAGRLEVRGGAAIATDATSAGAPGHILVVASEAQIEGRGEGAPSRVSSRNASARDGGDLEIRARTLALRDGAEITVESSGLGDAGSLVLRVADAFVVEGGRVSTSAPNANGGDVQILVGRLVRLRGATISADVGDGRGGSVLIDPQYVVLDASRISAQAGAGVGGSIRIVGDTLLLSPDSVLSASAGPAGIDGRVSLEGQDTDQTESLQALPAAFAPATELLRSRCAAARGARGSLTASTATRARAGESGFLPPPPPADAAAQAGEPVALLVDGRDRATAHARLVRCGGAS